jgi:hypothetical protein
MQAALPPGHAGSSATPRRKRAHLLHQRQTVQALDQEPPPVFGQRQVPDHLRPFFERRAHLVRHLPLREFRFQPNKVGDPPDSAERHALELACAGDSSLEMRI